MENREEKQNNMEVYYRSVLLNLEQAAKTNRFSSKEEFNKYLEGIKKNGMPESIMSEEKVKEMLDMYDEYHKVEEAELDMQNYKGTNLNEQNYIVSTKNDTILKTNSSNEELPQEFKTAQNELTAANGTDSLANADTVYNNLKETKKEEIDLIPLYEMVERDNISGELLTKIKFFITNKYINPYSFKVSPESGLFYNTETDEVLEVRQNLETGKYEIIKGGQVLYKENSQSQAVEGDTITNNTEDPNQEKEEDINEEKMIYENGKPKVRRRIPPKDINSQAAFAKTSFLIIASIFLALALSSLFLLLK